MTTEPEAIPADVMELAKEAHANFARSSVTDNLTTIIACSILADRIRNASPVGWSVRGAEAYRLFTDEAEAREWAGDWGLIKLVYESAPAASPSGGESLIWDSTGSWSKSASGEYAIHMIGDGAYLDFGGDICKAKKGATLGRFKNKAEARAAAQADYEQRILSNLTSPEAPQASEVVRELVSAVENHLAALNAPVDQDIWDTETGEEEPGASRSSSDWAFNDWHERVHETRQTMSAALAAYKRSTTDGQ